MQTIESQFKTAFKFYKDKNKMFLEVNNTAVAFPLGNSSTKDSSNWMNQYKQSLNRKLNKKLCIEGDIGETEIQR